MKNEAELLLRTEELLIKLLGGKQPTNAVLLELLADISEWLQRIDPERN